MAGVHRLQHVERFLAAALTDDDAVGPHSQRVLQQITHRDLTGAFEIGGTRFETHDMWLLQLQLGGVFDGHGTLGTVNHPRQRIQQRGFTRTGTA